MLIFNSIVLQNIRIYFDGVFDILYCFRSIDLPGLVDVPLLEVILSNLASSTAWLRLLSRSAQLQRVIMKHQPTFQTGTWC